jgi:uncharacterized protein with HEPN domain
MIEKKAPRVPDYIEHILEAITRIEAYVNGLDQSAFVGNTLVQDAVIRNFEVIGEAANKIQTADATFAQLHPDLRLEQAYRMRNALAHGYDSVNLRTVWHTIQSDLPILKQQVTAILRASRKDG